MIETLKILWDTVFLPLLDIGILAFLIYKTYELLLVTNALPVLRGLLFLGGLYLLAFVLGLSTLRWILSFLAPGLVLGVFVIFQPELRRIFTRLGQGQVFGLGARRYSLDIDAVLNAMEVLSAARRGALIVLSRSMSLRNAIETGIRLDAELSSSLLITIFGHDTPLHDGAVVIEKGRVVAAACFLPLSEQPQARRAFGARHRAALGLAEQSDAVVLVVSEETGALSLAYESKLLYDLSPEDLRAILAELLRLPRERTRIEQGEGV